MKLRTQLILAFFLLAVLPLAGVSVYSYNSSLRAVRQTAESESEALASDMGERMESVSGDLNRRIQRLSGFPFSRLMAGGQKEADQQKESLMKLLMAQMGESAPLIRALEFVPAGPPGEGPPPPRAPRASRSRKLPPSPAEDVGGLVIHMPGNGAGAGSEGGPPDAGTSRRNFMHLDAGREHPGDAAPPFPPLPGINPEQIRRLVDIARQNAEKQAEAWKRSEEIRRLVVAGREKTQAAGSPESNAQPGHRYLSEVRQDGELVGQVRAQVSTRQLLHTVLSRTRRKQGEIPFAIDPEGKIYPADPADLPKIEALPLQGAKGKPENAIQPAGNWVVVTRKDPVSGATFGIARPINDRLDEIKRTALRNLLYGLGMVSLALIGILPLSSRMTRNLTILSRGADQLARGDLNTRVQLKSKDEIGQLAQSFNRMAQDLSDHQKRLVEQERLRNELEMCRKIQVELLPRQAYRTGLVEVKGVSIPAREVGGDFFNYFPLPNGDLAIIVGDVSGKGLPAAMLMANLQATIHAKLPLELDLAKLADQLDREIASGTPPELYLTLFLAILETGPQVLHYVNAGHNSQFVLRNEGSVERLESSGRPLGLLPGGGYANNQIQLMDGDSLFFYTDGLVESENETGQEFGMHRLETLLVKERSRGLDGMLAQVELAANEYRGSMEAADDATMVLVKIGKHS